MILDQGQFTFKKKNPNLSSSAAALSCQCAGAGGGGRRKKTGKAEAEAAENRKRFIRAEVRLLAWKHKCGGDTGGFPHLGDSWEASSTGLMLLSIGKLSELVVWGFIFSLKILVGKVSFIADSD